MQFLVAEDRVFHAWPLFSPFLLLSLPAMAVTAAVALLFETIQLLRGGFGNILWFFLWSLSIGLPGVVEVPQLDPSGLWTVFRSMVPAAQATRRFGHGWPRIGINWDKGFLQPALRLRRWMTFLARHRCLMARSSEQRKELSTACSESSARESRGNRSRVAPCCARHAGRDQDRVLDRYLPESLPHPLRAL